ncbi:DNA-binding protein [Rhodoferax sp. U2-2l]|uniref:DNA-binding protein n=1 Tax=Rhodoferax sp. U2-2l TaxID=2884000 RepID=UPI001D0B72CF|nr:DNA-binding protein [Rhodoferax sp. U2-2l]MCB8748936.1 DNA-binding protein [Rhodoferax sp. U2-2l]
MNADIKPLERRRPGPKGIDQKTVFEAADGIWQGGQGPVPTIQGVRAILGTGSTVKLGEFLAMWRARHLGAMSAPAIPKALAKAVNDHFEVVRSEIENNFQALINATEHENSTLLESLADVESQLEEAQAELMEVRQGHSELVGRVCEQAENIQQLRADLAAVNEINLKAQVATTQAQTELEFHLQRLATTEIELDITKRQYADSQQELEATRLDLATTRESLAGAQIRVGEFQQQRDSHFALAPTALPEVTKP